MNAMTEGLKFTNISDLIHLAEKVGMYGRKGKLFEIHLSCWAVQCADSQCKKLIAKSPRRGVALG